MRSSCFDSSLKQVHKVISRVGGPVPNEKDDTDGILRLLHVQRDASGIM